MKMSLEEQAYYSLLGELTSDAALPWVENAFESDSYCEEQYARILTAYGRLRQRLGVEDEDADVEIIIDSLLNIQRELCMCMFRIGATS